MENKEMTSKTKSVSKNIFKALFFTIKWVYILVPLLFLLSIIILFILGDRIRYI